ncbi:DUF4349 domain-containing protein [Phosphitispora fastidiosa]|uniref:DUF4349 domain-containing protein n=1 Tax=Phosphitispora fastidiosa TaxID=2837202 RepID=UPI001E2C0E49|nr:DUF4349 domain-containing protein [Phosphitispora fastidiosa]MBU7006757.1 hypothetical protein [Phosphitispora fastidiosa]
MQCSEIRELLSAYIDGVLDTNENTAVKEHLRTCSECSRDLADLQETIRLLRSLGDIRPPEGFRQELRGKLEKEPLPAGSIKNLFWTQKARRWIAGPGKYLAASFIIIGLGLSTGIYNLLQSGILPKSASYEMALEQKTESGTDRAALESVPQNGKEKSIAEIPAGESDTVSSTARNPQAEQNEGFIAGAPADIALRKALAPEGKGGGTVDPAADQTAGNSINYSAANPETTVLRSSYQEGASQDSITDQPQQPFMKSSEILITAMETPESGTTTSEAYPESPEESAGSVLITPNYDSGASKNSEKSVSVSEDAALSNNGIKGEIDQEAAKDGFLSIEVSNYKEFEPKLTGLVDRFNGSVESSTSLTGELVNAGFVIRVPANSFNEMLGKIEALGKVAGKQVSDRDMSTEIDESQSRMDNLRNEEERLLGLVDKANSLDEALTLEKELARVRDESELIQGKLNTLNESGQFSLIRLDIREAAPAEAEPVPEKSAAGWLLPIALIIAGIGGVIYYFRIRRAEP